MPNKPLNKKYVFLGDTHSINIEIICKSFSKLKKKTDYILIGNIKDLQKYLFKIKSKIEIKEIFDPFNFRECNNNLLNIFNVENVSKKKFKNLLNQLKIANNISNTTKIDLVTMPINKDLFKKEIQFMGMTEYLGKLNKRKTIMLMYGEKFSIIPYTTHINLKMISKNFNKIKIDKFLINVLNLVNSSQYNLKYLQIKFLCYNPHCGENETIGKEDKLISKIISKYTEISGPYPADSSFNKIENHTLFISTYHDQALIPFKILNKKGVNITLGLDYKRISPAHGTAKDKLYKNISDNSSYLSCMQI